MLGAEIETDIGSYDGEEVKRRGRSETIYVELDEDV